MWVKMIRLTFAWIKMFNQLRYFSNYWNFASDFREFGKHIFFSGTINFELSIVSLYIPKNKALRSQNHNQKVKNDSWSTYAKIQYIISICELVNTRRIIRRVNLGGWDIDKLKVSKLWEIDWVKFNYVLKRPILKIACNEIFSLSFTFCSFSSFSLIFKR